MNKQKDLQQRKELAKLGGGQAYRKTARQGKLNRERTNRGLTR